MAVFGLEQPQVLLQLDLADLLANRNRLPSHIRAARTIERAIAISKSCCIVAKRIDFKKPTTETRSQQG